MSDSLPEQEHRPRMGPHWLLGLSMVAAVCGVAWLLVARVDSPFSAACVLTTVFGWVLYRFGRASRAGVVLWCAGAVAISEAYWAPIPGELSGIWKTCIVLGGLLPLASSVVFLDAAVKRCTRQAVNCGGCVLALCTLIGWIVVGGAIHNARGLQEDIQETTRTLVTIHRLAQDIESIRARLGRLPTDEKELVRLRGKPMPQFGSGHYPISYYRNGNLDYRLSFSFASFWGRRGDFYVACYSGPNTAPRLFVDLF